MYPGVYSRGFQELSSLGSTTPLPSTISFPFLCLHTFPPRDNMFLVGTISAVIISAVTISADTILAVTILADTIYPYLVLITNSLLIAL